MIELENCIHGASIGYKRKFVARRNRNYSIEELKSAANLMRGYNLAALCAAGSGHAGGTLSIMDITAALSTRASRPAS